MQCLMKFDLVSKSESCSMGFEFILHDYLGCCLAFCLHIFSDETICESTLAKEAAFEVLPDHFLSVYSTDVLVDDIRVLGFVFSFGEMRSCAFVFGNTHNFYRNLKIIEMNKEGYNIRMGFYL